MSKSNKLTAPTIEQSSNIPILKQKKHLKVIEKTYSSNTNSDYTEKLWDLGNNFDYTSNSNHYWGNPELSLLYGTPLYEVASPCQKLALNHLFWVANYHYIAVSEASTSLYNMVTSGVFHNLGGYEQLCRELELETEQESYHIRTFQKVVYSTKKSLLGKTILGNPLASKMDQGLLGKLLPKPLQTLFLSGQYKTIFSVYQDYILSFIAKKMLENKKQYYSEYLREIEQKDRSVAAASEGILGQVAPRHWVKFFTLNWGISPFMACQYYCIRYTANAYLKNHEYVYYKNYQELQKKSEFIPNPTAISYYHLLDESFHTTISQTIAKDMYKELPKPTAYEKFLSSQIISMMQKNMLSGLSGALPGRFVADSPLFMLFVYKLLKSPVFGMSNQDSLYWMEKCFCQEHDGFHVGLKYHGKLLESLRRVFGSLEYQSSVNREMKIMATGGSIGKAITGNTKVFKKFSRSISHSN
ncbi:MAG: hypothetical protein VKN72_28340 [Nostocales cyanobacterium 94392]|nr:hypothetical protein [Nostocales cyanobacterium 94392]